jgi:serine/threonine protein kinase
MYSTHTWYRLCFLSVHSKEEIEMLCDYTLTSRWRNNKLGQIASATKNGQDFFIQKYIEPIMPLDNGLLDEITFHKKKKEFDCFVERRTHFNGKLRTLLGECENIVIIADEFVENNCYFEVWNALEGVIPSAEWEFIMQDISPAFMRIFLITATGALAQIHNAGLIHANVSMDTVLPIKDMRGVYTAKLIEVSKAFFKEEIPDTIMGDSRYYSPELATYLNEENNEAAKRLITEKTDIFSLGLIFHYCLAGEFPQAKDLTECLQERESAYCWSILLNGCPLEISRSIPEGYRKLISDMLKVDPAERPTAIEVMRGLKTLH